jgi:hypothetical protein
MTFNVRGSYHRDGLNTWNNRAPLNVETIKHHAPHLIGFQELQGGNLETYQEVLRSGWNSGSPSRQGCYSQS